MQFFPKLFSLFRDLVDSSFSVCDEGLLEWVVSFFVVRSRKMASINSTTMNQLLMIAWLSPVILPSPHRFSKSAFKRLTSLRTEALSRVAIHVKSVSLRQTHHIIGFFGLCWSLMSAVNRIFEAEPFAQQETLATRTEPPLRSQLNQGYTISIFRH